MEITPFKPDYQPEMAALFVQNFKRLRAAVPALPDRLESTADVSRQLEWLSGRGPMVVALDRGRVVGYLGYVLVDHFRQTERRAAYCPEWGHAAADDGKPAIYRALYRAAAQQWNELGCQAHVLTLLAQDRQAEQTWFWNGFGLAVVDAIREMKPLETTLPADLQVRKAGPEDFDALCQLEIEHMQHYREPPVLMIPHEPWDADALAQFLANPHNSLWLALDGAEYMGYLRFEADHDDAPAVIWSPDNVANTGAYVRPQYRGRKAGPALLDAALRDYAAQGFRRCSVDFESFNPEAAAFWLKYFEPVCLSVMRVPERQPAVDAG